MSAKSLMLALLVLFANSAPGVSQDLALPGTSVLGPVDDLELHATEAGILDRVTVKEGAWVRAEDVLVQIDTSEAKKAKEIAKYDLRASVERARDDIEVLYAEAAADAAEATVDELLETNRSVAKAVTEADLRQARLEHRRSVFAIKKAKHDMKLAELEVWTKKAEFEAAEMAIERRTLRAPFNGVVIEQFRDQKEWVNPGDPILRLVRLDELQVECLAPISEHAPSEFDGCEVTIDVPVGGGKVVKAPGRIVFINPVVLRGSNVKVRAEVANREHNGRWVILPGMNAKMTIHLGTGGAAAVSRGETQPRR